MIIKPFEFERKRDTDRANKKKTMVIHRIRQKVIFCHAALYFLLFHHCAFLHLWGLVRGTFLGNTTGRFIIYFLVQSCLLFDSCVGRFDDTSGTVFYSCFIHFHFIKMNYSVHLLQSVRLKQQEDYGFVVHFTFCQL